MRYLSKLLKAEEVSVRSPRMIGDCVELLPERDSLPARQMMDELLGDAVRQAEEIAEEARLRAIQAFIQVKGEALTAGYAQGLAQSHEAGGETLKGRAAEESAWLADRVAEMDAQQEQTLAVVRREALDFAFGLAGKILDGPIDRSAPRFAFLTGKTPSPEPKSGEEERPGEEALPEAAATLAPAGDVNLTVHMGGGSLRVEEPDGCPFSFDDIAGMDDKALRRLAAACELKDIMTVLRGSDGSAAQRIRQVLPERIRATVDGELVLMGPVSPQELEGARRRILRVFDRMRREDRLDIPKPSGGVAVG